MSKQSIDAIFKMALGPTPGRPSEDDYRDYDEATESCYEAWECLHVGDKKAAIEPALAAAEKSRYCSDAFNVLAECLPTDPGESLTLHCWGMRIGEAYLGKECFKQERGNFYSLLETRPYMRARFNMATDLMNLGCPDDATAHLQALLHLDPTDHLGARLLLSVTLLMTRRYDEFHKFHKKNADGADCYWRYGEVFFQDAIGAKEDQFVAALERAMQANKFVPVLLWNPRFEFERFPFGVSWSGPDGAEEYLRSSAALWDSNPELKRRLVKAAKKLMPDAFRPRQD